MQTTMRAWICTAVVAFVVVGAFVAEPTGATTVDELRRQIEAKSAEIRQLEEEAVKLRSDISANQGQQKTLRAELARIDSILTKLRRDVAITSERIRKATAEIAVLEIEIAEKNASIVRLRSGIAGLLESLSERSAESPVFAFFKYWRLSEFFADVASIQTAQARMFGFLEDVKRLKEELESTKAEAEAKKAELEGFRADLWGQQKTQESVQKDRSNLLMITKSQEARYQALLKEREAKTRALEEEIFSIEEKIRITIDPTSLPPKRPGVLRGPLPDTSTKSCWDGGETAKNCVTQYFGNTPFAISGAYNGKGHNGIDFRASHGTTIFAAASGVVKAIGDTDLECKGVSYGKWILIEHGNNLSTMYAHLSSVSVTAGQGIARGDRIGYSGSTGYATGPHLHFTVFATQGVEIRKVESKVCGTNMTVPISALNGYLNPLDYL